MGDPFDDAVTALAGCADILVFTGAGISTESGIPDFRGPNGLWKRLDPADFTYDRYLGDAEFRRQSWGRRFDSPFLGAEPNQAHHAVTSLWQAGRAVGCVTQNVDGLHRTAGLADAALVEVHGNASQIRCVACGARPPMTEVEDRWRAGDPDPACEACGGLLKTNIVFFGEDMPEHEMVRAWSMAERADGVLVIGSTMSVYPAAFVPLDVVDRGFPLVIVNQGPTDHDIRATVKIDGPAGEVVPSLAAALGVAETAGS